MAFITAALLGGTILGSTFLATATAAALNLAIGLGVELAVSALTKPDAPKFSIQGKLQAGEDTPRTVPVGYTATAGSLVYANTWGTAGKTKNAYFTQVIALSDVPVSGLAGMWVGEEKVTLPDMSGTAPKPAGWPIVEYTKKGKNYLDIRFYDGTQTTAPAFLTDYVSTSDRPYESTRVGKGVAYVVVTARINDKLFTGLPTFRFELNGARLYDITQDGSAGGTGLHRWDDPSTWGGDGDDLPAVQIYNILRGVTYGGKWLYGAQSMPEARLPRADWIAAINKCREDVELSGTATEPAYRAGTEIRVSTPGLDSIKLLQDACQGHLAEAGGVYTLHVGAPPDASFTLTDDDILSTEEQIFTPFQGLADTINGITAKYPSPADAWNSKDAPPLYSSDYEAEDGDRRLISDLSLDAVPYDAQVQRIMKAALAEARRARRHTMVLPPKFWKYAVPNVVFTWTSARNDYTTKSFRIDGAVDKANLDNMVNVTEVDPTDFDFDYDTDFTPVSEGALGLNEAPSLVMTGWNAAPITITDADGNDRRPAIQVTFGGDLDDVQFVRVQVRLAGETTLQFDGTVPYGDLGDDDTTKSVTISFASILPNTAYEVRGILIPYSGNDALWSNESLVDGEIVEGEWLGVTTDDIRFGRLDLYDGIIDIGALADEVRDLQENFAANIRALSDQIAQVALGDADGQFGAYLDAQAVYTKVVAQTGGLSAAVETAILAATGPDSAIATAITALNGASDGQVADATWQISTEYTAATGWDSKWGIQVRASTDDGWADAGLFAEAKSDGTGRILIVGDQVVVVDSEGNVAALFETGTTYIDSARIHSLTADNIDVESLTSTEGFFEYLVVEDGQIAAGAVTLTDNDDFSGAMTTDNNWHTVASLTIDSPSGNPLMLFYDWDASVSTTVGTGGGSITCDVRITVDGTEVDSSTDTDSRSGSGTVVAHTTLSQVRLTAVSTGSHTVAIQTRTSNLIATTSNSCEAHMVVQVNKV